MQGTTVKHYVAYNKTVMTAWCAAISSEVSTT